MSWFEQITAKAAQVQSLEELETTEARDKLGQHVPRPFTLKELADAAREPLNSALSTNSRARIVRTQLLSVLACLRREGRITPEPSTDHDVVKELALNMAKLIAPVVTEDQPEVSNQDLLRNSQALAEKCQANSGLGIAALEALMKQTTTPVWLDDEVLYTLLAYTDGTQTEGSHETEVVANRLLNQQFSIPGSPTKDEFLTETVLQAYLRPLFSKSKPSSITASGRKAEYTDGAGSKAESMPDESAVTKPWKYTDMRAIPAVAWAVREANTQLIAQHWPLFIPVLLTLADDTATPIRRRGLLILADFLAKFPDKTLHGTGLAQVFEDAVFPTLSYLPSLTPEDESVALLVPAYGALLGLARKQPAVAGRDKDGIVGAPKKRFLDRMLREGVLGGYFHAKDHVRIVEVLCQQTVAILDEMGVHAVKHLKDLVPMLSTIMTDPFAPAAPEMLLSAIKALQAVLTNCWPRIPHSPWQDEIINALVLSWLHLAEHNHAAAAVDKTYAHLQQELLISSRALAAVLKAAGGEGAGAIDLSSHVALLVEKDPRLAALFPSN